MHKICKNLTVLTFKTVYLCSNSNRETKFEEALTESGDVVENQ